MNFSPNNNFKFACCSYSTYWRIGSGSWMLIGLIGTRSATPDRRRARGCSSRRTTCRPPRPRRDTPRGTAGAPWRPTRRRRLVAIGAPSAPVLPWLSHSRLYVENVAVVRLRDSRSFELSSHRTHTSSKINLNWNLHVFREDCECGEGGEGSQDELVHLVMSI